MNDKIKPIVAPRDSEGHGANQSADSALNLLLKLHDPGASWPREDETRLQAQVMRAAIAYGQPSWRKTLAGTLSMIVAAFERQTLFMSGAAMCASVVVLGLVIGIGIAALTEETTQNYVMANAMTQSWE